MYTISCYKVKSNPIFQDQPVLEMDPKKYLLYFIRQVVLTLRVGIPTCEKAERQFPVSFSPFLRISFRFWRPFCFVVQSRREYPLSHIILSMYCRYLPTYIILSMSCRQVPGLVIILFHMSIPLWDILWFHNQVACFTQVFPIYITGSIVGTSFPMSIL